MILLTLQYSHIQSEMVQIIYVLDYLPSTDSITQELII